PALIAVPIWMMATRSHMDARIDLDSALVPPPDRAGGSEPAERKGEAAEGPRPLVASMTALPQRQSQVRQPEPPPALSLRFSEDSWVEVFDPQGRVGMGDVAAAEVRRIGGIQDRSEFQRANVARFTVPSDGSIAPPRQ